MTEQAKKAISLLQDGMLVAIPTETVYGLAASIECPHAIESIFRVKERPFFDPLIVHVAGFEQVNQVAAEFPAPLRRLAEKYWPGPLTVVLPKRPELNSMITSSHDTVAVRWPAHPLAAEVIRAAGPVAAPSANKFGRTSPTTAAHVRSEFGDEVFVLDGGPCEIGIESTVVGYRDDAFEIYRPGAVTAEEIGAFGKVIERPNPVAPGQLQNHYQPKLPLVWLRETPHLTEDVYRRTSAKFDLDIVRPAWITLSPDPTIAAREMYGKLRAVSSRPEVNVILLRIPSAGFTAARSALWDAVEDRLTKASSLTL